MSLEDNIKDLEHRLAVKKAYLGLKLQFPARTSAKVKEEVNSKIKDLCLKLADDQEAGLNSGNFSEEEVKVLKMLANRALSRPEKASKAKLEPNPESSAPEPEKPQNKAILMSMDGVPLTLRSKIAPQSELEILEDQGELLKVREFKFGNIFNVPSRDVEIL